MPEESRAKQTKWGQTPIWLDVHVRVFRKAQQMFLLLHERWCWKLTEIELLFFLHFQETACCCHLSLGYGDIVYMSTSTSSWQMLGAVYHGARRLITGCKPLTCHCTLHSLLDLSSLSTRKPLNWYNFTHTSIPEPLTSYLSLYTPGKQSNRSLLLLGLY